ncbi:MAG: hypothetical protein ABTQ34_08835 [Bdellovibrionales bacterium]
MKINARRKVLTLFLGLLLLFLSAGLPSISYAAGEDPCEAGENSPVDKAVRTLSAEVAKEMMILSTDVLLAWGAIDIKKDQCFDKLKLFFDAIMNIGISFNPFDFFVSILKDMIVEFINEACNYAVGSLDAMKDSILSQLNRMCIPFPNLGINLGDMPKFDYQECSGFAPISVTTAPNQRTWDKYNPDNMIRAK